VAKLCSVRPEIDMFIKLPNNEIENAFEKLSFDFINSL
jgi:hypothetical protein